MSNSLVIMLAAAAFAGLSAVLPERTAGDVPLLVAMGPDPGGHTGAGVTPETTKADRPGVDAARTAASGGKVENNTPKDPSPSKPSGGKPGN